MVDRFAALSSFPFFRSCSPALQREVMAEGHWCTYAAGEQVFSEGRPSAGVPIVVSGRARVSLNAPCGRQITLYVIGSGEACALSMLCSVQGGSLPARAVADARVEAFIIPPPSFRRLLDQSREIRRFTFETVADRFGDLLELVNEIAFLSLEARLAGCLVDVAVAEGGPDVHQTHEQLAARLGSAREVVSRLLRDFEGRGAIERGRGRIRVVDPAYLRRVAAAAPNRIMGTCG